MNILVCSDGGYLAPGIAALACVAGESANVRVVAPEHDRSDISNSLTLDRPLHIKQVQNGFHYVNGMPTDCIHLGLHALPGFRPDLVFSDISNGADMGDDTFYSGTVTATTGAYLMSIPAVVFSLNDYNGRYWETAGKAAWMMIDRLVRTPPKLPVLWNVNIPAVAFDEIQGIKITRLGRRHHRQSVVPMHNPRGEPIYWIGPVGDISNREESADFGEYEAEFITVIPLQIDLIDYAQLEGVVRFWEGVVKAERVKTMIFQTVSL